MRLKPAQARALTDRKRTLDGLAARLNSVSHEGVLARGFALVTDANGKLVRAASALTDGDAVMLEFRDAKRGAVIGGGDRALAPSPARATPAPRKAKPKPKPPAPGQGDLF